MGIILTNDQGGSSVGSLFACNSCNGVPDRQRSVVVGGVLDSAGEWNIWVCEELEKICPSMLLGTHWGYDACARHASSVRLRNDCRNDRKEGVMDEPSFPGYENYRLA